jgi:subtilisin family serine protease
LQARSADGTPASRSRVECGFEALDDGQASSGLSASGHSFRDADHGRARPARWWVFFNDKDLKDEAAVRAALERVERSLTVKAKERRTQIFGSLALDERDIPVSPRYIQALKDAGFRVKARSRWLNAVSVTAPRSRLDSVIELPFVKAVKPVLTYKRKPVEELTPVEESPKGTTGKAPSADPGYYNRTWDELQQINVPAVHDLGYTGTGVIICMLDTGYNLAHEAFQEIDVIAEWDFVQDDSVTSNQAGDHPSQHNHGTYTLSNIGGFKPNEFVGGAPDAQFMLGKTEIYDQEIQIEEDNYVMGLEWADSGGARIVSSSLGYLDWYTYEDMDGNTAVTTIAVDIAASKGITVVTAMGNERQGSWHYMIAPADADSAISVGAVDFDGNPTSFSSVGPTADGRIKPDVVARGYGNSSASPYDSTGYASVSGTSLSTPLVAAVSALLAEAHPDWDPITIRYALRSTADQAFEPDTLRGWGLVDALAAVQLSTVDTSGPRTHTASYCGPNPFRSSTTLFFNVGHRSSEGSNSPDLPVEIAVYDVAGRLQRTLFRGSMRQGPNAIEWDGADSSGRRVPTGLYMLRVSYPGGGASAKVLFIR